MSDKFALAGSALLIAGVFLAVVFKVGPGMTPSKTVAFSLLILAGVVVLGAGVLHRQHQLNELDRRQRHQ